MNPTRRRLLQAAASIPLTPSPSAAARSFRAPAMTAEEAQFIQRLTARMTTRCIGRHLIDLPEQFVLNPVQEAVIDEVHVEIGPLAKDRFEAELRQYRQKLESTRHVPEGHEFLRNVHPIEGGLLFDRGKDYVTARSFRQLEARWWKGGYACSAEIGAVDNTFPEDLADPILGKRGMKTDIPEKLATLRAVIARVRGRRDHEIPSEPGDGFAHGFWQGAQAPAAEFSINYHLQGTPDVYIHLRSVSGDARVARPDTGLMQRRAQIERQIQRSGAELLWLRPRVIHRKAYEESAGREPAHVTSARVPGHSAVLQTDQAVEGRSAPFFKMLMFNGHYIPSPPRSLEEQAKIPDLQRATLSEAQMLALWEAITATLRPRPGAL